MSGNLSVVTNCDTDDKPVEDRGEAIAARQTHVDLCDDCSKDDVEIVADGDGAKVPTDTGTGNDLPEQTTVDEDPITWMPEHFVDTIEGVPTINRKGFAVIAEHYGIEVVAEPVTLPSDTDHEYAEFRAVAVTDDGKEYSGFGSAHADRGDDRTLLAELAETRAMKRATSWATGVGMTAVEEMQNAVLSEQ